MRLEQLEYLMEINKTHSINSASQYLHVSQQNISKSIQNLEAELGLELLTRGTEGTYLTPDGLLNWIPLKDRPLVYVVICVLCTPTLLIWNLSIRLSTHSLKLIQRSKFRSTRNL